MERTEKIKKLLESKRISSQLHAQYLSTPREYLQGEMLYMREAHFVVTVGEGEPPTMSELASRLEVTQGAASQMALRMEQKGFIIRVKPQEDKRRNLVLLTEKGKELCARHREYDERQLEELNQLFREFATEDLDKLIRYEILARQIFIEQGVDAPAY